MLDTRTQLIVTAERLFGRHGLDGISLRQIGVEAGQKNKGAVHYHFGTRDDLIAAVFELRVPAIDAVRQEMLGRIDVTDPALPMRTLVECLAWPLAMTIVDGRGESHYLRFLSEAATSLSPERFMTGAALAPGYAQTLMLIDSRMNARGNPIESDRAHWARLLYIHLLADLERRAADGGRDWRLYQVEQIIDICTAALETPPSLSTRSAYARCDDPNAPTVGRGD